MPWLLFKYEFFLVINSCCFHKYHLYHGLIDDFRFFLMIIVVSVMLCTFMNLSYHFDLFTSLTAERNLLCMYF